MGSDIDDDEDENEENKDGENENEMDFGDGWLLGDDEVIYEGEKNLMSGDYQSDVDSDVCSDDESENKPKRVVSTYMLWLKDNREKLKAEVMQRADFDQAKVSVLIAKRVGEVWNLLSDEEKKMYLIKREELVKEAEAEFELMKLANKDKPKERRKRKKHKFANNSEIGHELVVGVLYDVNEPNAEAGISQLLQYNVMPLSALPLQLNSSSLNCTENKNAANALGFKKLSPEEIAAQRELKRIRMEKIKLEKVKQREEQKKMNMQKFAAEELKKEERKKKKEEEKRLRMEKIEHEKQLRIQKAKEREAERERARLEKKKLAEQKVREKALREKAKEIKAIHLAPFLTSIHNKVKKTLALDSFYSRFPQISKKNVEKLLKLICVRESRDFDRIKWYVKDEFRKLILANPEECMKKINELQGGSVIGNKRKSEGDDNNDSKKNKLQN